MPVGFNMMMIPLVATAIVVLAAVVSAGRGRPDFSGEWVLNRADSTLSPGADSVESGVWRIEHRDPMFRHQATLVFRGGKPFNYQYESRSDGGEVVGDDRGARMISTLRWDGVALVFTTRTARAGGETTVSYRYEIIRDGSRLRATERVRGTDHDQDNVWMFDRR